MAEKILLVDDNPAHRDLYGGQLSEAGYRVHKIATGGGALRAIERGERPDAVILGINLDDAAGIDTLGEIVAKRPEVPVVLHSAHPSLKDDFRVWGACAIISKSSEKDRLCGCVREVLGRRRVRAIPRRAVENVG